MDARTFLDSAEEIGVLEEQALEAFAGEHDLDEDELAAFRAELEARGVEFVDETHDSGVCHMSPFADPDGNRFMLHRRYAPRD